MATCRKKKYETLEDARAGKSLLMHQGLNESEIIIYFHSKCKKYHVERKKGSGVTQKIRNAIKGYNV